MDPDIQARFHQQIIQHGQDFISSVAAEIQCDSPPGISITLGPIEFPEGQVNWVWFLGTVDAASEQAVLHFFQTDAGKGALVSSADGKDVVEFKLASTSLRLYDRVRDEQRYGPFPPADLSPFPPPGAEGQVFDLRIRDEPRPTQPVRVVARRPRAWLQIPREGFEQVLCLDLEGESPADTGLLGAWLIDSDNTPHGHVVAIVGARTVLARPMNGDALGSGVGEFGSAENIRPSNS
ncbi:hypothetical protein V8F33_002427 [Rhypophila sp. PSN 637]